MLQEYAKNKSIYQKTVPLQPGTYRLNVVAKDIVAGNMNNYEVAITVPRLDPDKASQQHLILADQVEKVPARSIGAGMFVIGGTKVRPRVDDIFKRDERMGIYMKVYNLGTDETTHKPAGEVEYDIVRKGSNEKIAIPEGEPGRDSGRLGKPGDDGEVPESKGAGSRPVHRETEDHGQNQETGPHQLGRLYGNLELRVCIGCRQERHGFESEDAQHGRLPGVGTGCAWPLPQPPRPASTVKLAGAIAGIVSDPGGIPQMGATVVLFNRQDRPLQKLQTDDHGEFRFTGLFPDMYSVRVSLAAFFPAFKRGILVQPGMRSLLNVKPERPVQHHPAFLPGAIENGGVMSDDWKWVLRSAASTRPVMRLLDKRPLADTAVAGPAGFRHRPRVRISPIPAEC